MNNQPLRQVMETTYLEVVLTGDFSGDKDFERANLAFSNNSPMYITDLILLIKMYC